LERFEPLHYYNHNAERILARRERSPSLLSDLQPFLNELDKNSRILDWGCGPGLDALEFSKAGHRAVGVDASPQMVDLAQRKNLNPRAEFLCKNGLLLSFLANEWDAVWMNESLNDLPSEHAQRGIAACFKGVRPEGTLGIIVREGQGFFEDREDDFEGPSRLVYLYGEKALCSLVEQTGFMVTRVGHHESDADGVKRMMILAKKVTTHSGGADQGANGQGGTA